MKAFEDPNHEGNSVKYHTGRKCIEAGCDNKAGTFWSPYWCFNHNVERMHRISKNLEEISKSFGD